MDHRYRERRAARRAAWFGTLATVLVLALAAAPGARAQQVVPEFEVDAVSVRADDSSARTRLDVYTRIPFAHLQFINAAEGFTARYAVSVEAYTLDDRDRRAQLVQSRLWEADVTVPGFAQTQSRQLADRSVERLDLAPGRYLLAVELEDRNTRETFERELPVEVRDLSGPLALGGLVLIDDYDAEAGSITPSVSHQVRTDQPGFKLFYEIYADRSRRVRLSREVVRVRKSSSPATVKSLLGLDRAEAEGPAEVSFREVEPHRLERGRNPFVVQIPTRDMKVGEYIIRIALEDAAGRRLDAAETRVVVQWDGLAEHVRDLDDAIDQLQYIAKRKDLEFIRAGRTADEREDRFLAFWDRRDPTPGTDRNERMEEYYYRIDYANRRFGDLLAGWRTDRGHVMVLFGEPDQVERHPDDFSVKPYEVWWYYGIGRRFIFIEQDAPRGFELLVPIWDERTRIR